MIILASSTSKILIGHQKSVNGYVDNKLAEMYAYETIKYAESYVYEFDLKYNLESPVISCDGAASKLNVSRGQLANADCLNIRRLVTLDKSINQTIDSGSCQNGFCYKPIEKNIYLANNSFNSDYSWQPWKLLPSVMQKVTQPCNSYIFKSADKLIPLVDDRASNYSILYPVNDESLCTYPRFIFEAINLDYRGVYQNDENSEHDIYYLNQSRNHDDLIIYKSKRDIDDLDSILINSARLYRITVVAFGRSGDTRVLLQEIIMINNHNTINSRTLGDSEDKRHNRIIRLSTRLFNDE
ncbi:MAG: hypothetical protein PHC75_00555 [Burkholderiales bacterium]|nr:hypothetical protein [Burkholderiales bacterium]